MDKTDQSHPLLIWLLVFYIVMTGRVIGRMSDSFVKKKATNDTPVAFFFYIIIIFLINELDLCPMHCSTPSLFIYW